MTSIFFSLPPAKKAIQRLSGDQNGQAGAVRAGQQAGAETIQVAKPKSDLPVDSGGEYHMATVGRNHGDGALTESSCAPAGVCKDIRMSCGSAVL